MSETDSDFLDGLERFRRESDSPCRLRLFDLSEEFVPFLDEKNAFSIVDFMSLISEVREIPPPKPSSEKGRNLARSKIIFVF